MTPTDYAFTVAWWTQLLKDDERMVRWLQKLQVTEFSGYQDNRDAADRWAKDNVAARQIFIATGDDEMGHSDLLINVLRGRGAWPTEIEPAESIYWTQMDKSIDSLESCAAVFHLGEQLAAERFKVLYEHSGTPSDIFHFLDKALPEEQHHARIFRKLTNSVTLIEIERAHNQAVLALKSS
jgi:hypothetical protein